jgi:hypothetical protein
MGIIIGAIAGVVAIVAIILAIIAITKKPATIDVGALTSEILASVNGITASLRNDLTGLLTSTQSELASQIASIRARNDELAELIVNPPQRFQVIVGSYLDTTTKPSPSTSESSVISFINDSIGSEDWVSWTRAQRESVLSHLRSGVDGNGNNITLETSIATGTLEEMRALLVSVDSTQEALYDQALQISSSQFGPDMTTTLGAALLISLAETGTIATKWAYVERIEGAESSE